jgi:glucose-1-phosphate thymidylyltransferase
VLERLERKVQGEVDADSKLVGSVVVEPGARIHNTVLRGPLIVGADTEIRDCYVGPFTAIDHHCVLRRCEIHHSIVMEDSIIEDIPTPIESSVIGRHARVERVTRRPHAYRLTLGDYSCLEVP